MQTVHAADTMPPVGTPVGILGGGEDMADYLTGPQAAELLGVDPSVVRRALLQRRMRGTKRGRDWYIKREEVERYAAERRNSGKPFKTKPTDAA